MTADHAWPRALRTMPGALANLGAVVCTIIAPHTGNARRQERRAIYNFKMLRAAFPAVMFTLLWCAPPTLAGFDWGSDGGTCAGSGTFQQQIPYCNIVDVGEIPAGKEGVDIRLTSEEDVDIQLYDKQSGEKIVHWPEGLLHGASTQSTQYHGITVEWSGYNGDGINLGREYIRLTGTTNRPFIMKVFGFHAGYATVDYRWGDTGDDQPFPPTAITEKASTS